MRNVVKRDTLCVMIPDAAPFSLGPERAERGAVLVHGFTGSPFEMRLLGEALAAGGMAVEGPRLAGHGGTTGDLAMTRWPDWVASAEDALDRLARRAERVAVCGLSMGGLVTLELARRRPSQVRAIALLATALWLPRAARWLDALVQKLPLSRWGELWGGRAAALPKLAGSDIADPEMRRLNGLAQGRAAMPLAALHSLIELGQYLKPRLGEVTQPALVAHGRQDHTVPFACLEHLTANLGSTVVERLVLERSFHVVTLDVEREQVFAAVRDHITKHA